MCSYKILLISAGDIGHCESYTVSIASQLSKYPVKVDTISPFPEKLPDGEGQDFFIPSRNFEGKEISNQKRYQEIYYLLEFFNKNYEMVYFVTLDELFHVEDSLIEKIGKFFEATVVTGSYFSSSIWRDPSMEGWCKKREEKLIKLNIDYAFTPDPILCYNERSLIQFKWLPDFATFASSPPNPEFVKKIYNKRRDRNVIGLFGSLGKWKGVYEVLKTLFENPDIRDRYILLLSGSFVWHTFSRTEIDDIKYYLKHLENDIVFIEGGLDRDEEFNSLFDFCDVVVCFYNNLQSSGVVSKGILKNKKLLLSDKGFLRSLKKAIPDVGVVSQTVESAIKKGVFSSFYAACYKSATYERYKTLLDPNFAGQVIFGNFLERFLGDCFLFNEDVFLWYEKHEGWKFYEVLKRKIGGS